MSSAEQFILMMRQAPNATLIGMRSGGSTGNPKPLVLPNGVTVWLPSWIGMDAEGAPFEGIGLDPDVEFEVTPARVRRADPTVERALEYLGER